MNQVSCMLTYITLSHLVICDLEVHSFRVISLLRDITFIIQGLLQRDHYFGGHYVWRFTLKGSLLWESLCLEGYFRGVTTLEVILF